MERVPQSLYPERVSEQLDSKVEALQALEAGDTETIQLSETERINILQQEAEFARQFEEIGTIKPIYSTIHIDYLCTPEGREQFEETFRLVVPDGVQTLAEWRSFIYEHASAIQAVQSKDRVAFTNQATKSVEAQMIQTLLETSDADGAVDASILRSPASVRLLLTPERSLDKLEKLRAFKTELKTQYLQLKESGSEAETVMAGVIELYLRRVNEQLADMNQTGRSLLGKQEAGVTLSPEETALLDQVFHAKNPEQAASRYDKFKHGVSADSVAGYRLPVGQSLREYTEQYATQFNESVLHSHERMRERGLDPAKVEDEQMYSPQEVKSFAEEVLTHYDLLSDEPAEMYDPDRTGPAADGKWQVIVGDFTSLSVDGVRQRIVKVPNATMSAKKLFPVGLAHEIEGHSLQHTNKLSLGLQLFSRFGADRSVVFAEGGAKYNEDYVSQAAFGVPSRSHPHFIRAIARKLEGGTYTDCVQTFYDSAIEPYQKLHQEQKLTDEEFTQKVSYFAKLAVNRARRLFRDGGDYNSTDGRHLSNSKDTAYLEGLMLSEQLRKAELHKYMYLTGVNLDAILFLLRSGLLSTEDIRKPDYISLDIWEREKHKFAPDAAGEMPL